MLRSVGLLCLAVGAQSEAVTLTVKNFDKKALSGKSAFVKFQAPW